jgi:hypothetical protein
MRKIPLLALMVAVSFFFFLKKEKDIADSRNRINKEAQAFRSLIFIQR